MKLILIRHGNTEASEKHLYCGSTDLPLSDSGRAALLERKASLGIPQADGFRVVTSGMRRCEETLLLLYGEIPHETDPALREMDCGAFEMRSYEEMKNDPDYIAWITGDNEANVCPGGESAVQHGDRCLNALTELLAREPGDLLIICHGGSITALMERLFPDEGENRWHWEKPTGRGYAVLFDGTVPMGHEDI